MWTYNGEKHLGEQLDSIARQQLIPEELVLCDDCSTDATVTIAEAFAKQSHFPVRIVRNGENLGYKRNFAKAIGLCSGEFIALCDQDDVWYPQKLKRLAELFCSDGAQVAGVFSNGDLIDSASRSLGRDLWDSFHFNVVDQERFRSGQAVEVLLQRNVVTGMTFAVRSSWKNHFHNMPLSWNHDAWLALILATRARLIACPEHLVAYRVHENQQIGVPSTFSEKRRYISTHGIGAYFRLSRNRNLKEYRENAVQFDDLRISLEKEAFPSDRELLSQVREKANHSHRGSAILSISRLRRWPTVLRHMKSYKQFSPTGIHAMFRDLVL